MTDQTARDRLIAYATTTRTVTVDGLDPLLDAVLAEAAVPSAVPAPATSAGARLDPARKAAASRRAALEEAIWDAGAGSLGQDDVDRILAAVLAVPSTAEGDATDRAAEIEQLRTENARMRHELEVMYGGAFDSVKDTPSVLAECDAIEADYDGQHDDVAVGARAAIMRIRTKAVEPEPAAERLGGATPGEIADAVMAVLRETEGEYSLAEYGYELARLIRPEELRRLAVEARDGQTTQGEAPCSDPIECSHEAALGQAQQEIRRLDLTVDEYAAGASALSDKLKRVRDAVAFAERVVATSGPGPASAVQAVVDRLRTALDPQAAVAPGGAGEEPAGEARGLACGCPSEDAIDHGFGTEDCTCIPFTRQTDPPRYCQPGDTVDMITGWERGADCPHHKPAGGAQQSEPTAKEPTPEQIAREHVTTLHLIGEQLTGIESWMWEHLADVRAASVQPKEA